MPPLPGHSTIVQVATDCLDGSHFSYRNLSHVLGVPLSVPGRIGFNDNWPAVQFELLGEWVKTRPWSNEETASLISQVLKEKKKLPRLHVPGRSRNAINAYRRFLRMKGLLGNAAPSRQQRSWNIKEIQLLRRLVIDLELGARAIVKKGLLRGRSVDSIGQMMRRRHLAANPARSRRMKNARRLSPAELKKLKAALLGPGRKVPSRQLSERFGITPGAVNRHRRLLGASLSWSEARNTRNKKPKKNGRSR